MLLYVLGQVVEAKQSLCRERTFQGLCFDQRGETGCLSSDIITRCTPASPGRHSSMHTPQLAQIRLQLSTVPCQHSSNPATLMSKRSTLLLGAHHARSNTPLAPRPLTCGALAITSHRLYSLPRAQLHAACLQQCKCHPPTLQPSNKNPTGAEGGASCLHRAVASHGNYGARFMELLARAGPRIEASADGWSHAQDLSFWVATLLPLNISQRLDFSRMTSTAARLQVSSAALYTCSSLQFDDCEGDLCGILGFQPAMIAKQHSCKVYSRVHRLKPCMRALGCWTDNMCC